MTAHFASNQARDRCKSCRKPIVWAETEKGRRIPLDPDPVSDGNIILQQRGKFKPPLAIVRLSIPTDETNRFKSHFATCPQASRWRKK